MMTLHWRAAAFRRAPHPQSSQSSDNAGWDGRVDFRVRRDKSGRDRSGETFQFRPQSLVCGIRRVPLWSASERRLRREPHLRTRSSPWHCLRPHNVHDVGELSADTQWPAKEKIENVDAVGCDIEERTASSFCRINEPAAAASSIKPHVIRQPGEHRLADYAMLDQFFGPLHFWITSAIIRDATRLAAFLRRAHHRAGFGFIHRHWLFTEHVLAGAE